MASSSLKTTGPLIKILNGQSPSNFINKFKFFSGGSRVGAN